MRWKLWLMMAFSSVFALACGEAISGNSESARGEEEAVFAPPEENYENRASALDAWNDEVWTTSFDPVHAHATDITVDSQRNIYVVGAVTGAFPGHIHSGARSAYFVRKYDPAGNSLWVRQIKINFAAIDSTTAVVAEGTDIYIAVTSTAYRGRLGAISEIHIQKLDRNGNRIWAGEYPFSSGGIDRSTGMTVEGSHLYIGGYSGATRGTWEPPAPDYAAVMVLNSIDGSQGWVRTFGDENALDEVVDVAADATGVYVTGWTDGTLAGETSAGARDAFIRKYDLAGTLVWSQQFGTDKADEPTGIVLHDGALYLSGWSEARSPSGGFGGDVGRRDAFARSYNLDGTLRWAEQLEVVSKSEANDIAVDATGVYIAGSTRPDGVSDSSQDASIIWKLSSDGVLEGDARSSTPSPNYGVAIALDGDRIYLASDTLNYSVLTRLGVRGAPCTEIWTDLVINNVADARRVGRIPGCYNVHGGVYVRNTTGIRNLNFLSGLRWVKESVGIADNADLRNLGGLENLQSVGDYFTVDNNPQLLRINTLNSLAEVRGQVNIFQNDILARINLGALNHTPRTLIVVNPELLSVVAPNFERATNEVRIDINETLRRIEMPRLFEVGKLLVRYNTEMRALDFSELDLADDIEFTRLAALRQLRLPSLQVVQNELWIRGNQTLRRVQAPNLLRVGARLRFETNAALRSIDMDALRNIGGRSGAPIDIGLLLRDNYNLPSLNLPALGSVSRTIEIDNNDALRTISMPSLEWQGLSSSGLDDGRFTISDNASLQNLDLHRLQRSGEFQLIQNPQLNQITPFDTENLEVHGDFEIIQNLALESLDAFPATTIDGHLWIIGNDAMPTCKAYQFLARATVLPFHPVIVILGNAPDSPGGTCP